MSKIWKGLGLSMAAAMYKKRGYSQDVLERARRELMTAGRPSKASFWEGFTGTYGDIGQSLQERSLARRRGQRQVDISMLSPGMLSVLLGEQRGRRRRKRRGAVVGGMGLAPTGQKTLLGE